LRGLLRGKGDGDERVGEEREEGKKESRDDFSQNYLKLDSNYRKFSTSYRYLDLIRVSKPQTDQIYSINSLH